MPNNVYIGSRYVPIFDGDWSSSKVYEALTIVNYNGSSYTSKKPVPAGTLPTNTTYWALTGNYNGQISNLQQQIDDMNDGSVSGSLQNQINNITGHHYLCVTDSYGETPSTTKSWIEKFASIVGSSNVTKAYKSGYAFAPNGYNAPFKNLITPGSVDTGVPSNYDTSKVTDIIVLGGFNDRSTAIDTILTAISSFCTYARNTYPNLKNIYIGAVGWSMNSEHISDLNHGNYIIAYKKCGLYGAKYLDGIENVMHRFDYFQQDSPSANVHVLSYNYVHPNENGSTNIAAFLFSALNGSASVQFEHSVFSFNTVSNLKNGNTTTIGITERVIDGLVKIGTGSMNLNHADNSAFSIGGATGVIDIATIDKGYYNAASNGLYIPVNAFIAGGNVSGNVPLTGLLAIDSGKLVFYYENTTGQSAAPTLIYIYSTEHYTSLIP